MTRSTLRRTLMGAGALTLAIVPASQAAASKAPARMPVTVTFTAVAGTAPVGCGTVIRGLGTSRADAQLEDLRFYVSNLRLVRANGTSAALTLTGSPRFNATVKGERTTLIDLEDGTGSCARGGTREVNALVKGTVPRGAYTGLRFYVGVPYTLNHTDVVGAPTALASAAMAWSWQAGRKFTKIEITDPKAGGPAWQTPSFMFHLGSTGCTGNPVTGDTVGCRASNRASVTLRRFDAAKQAVAFDLGALVAGNDVTRNTPMTGPGCMSGPTDPECGATFDAMGVDLATGAAMRRGTHQRVFRVVAR